MDMANSEGRREGKRDVVFHVLVAAQVGQLNGHLRAGKGGWGRCGRVRNCQVKTRKDGFGRDGVCRGLMAAWVRQLDGDLGGGKAG